MAPVNLSPSLIARYFFHDCPRFLRYSATPPARRRADGVPDAVEDKSITSRILTTKGFAWEDEVVGRRIPGKVLVAEGGAVIHERRFSADESKKILAAVRPGTGVYQSTLIVPKRFYARYGLDPAVCTFNECRPDLLWCVDGEDRPLLRVIDLKATDRVKTSHRIQVALYSLILESVLAEHAIERAADGAAAGIWLQDADAPEMLDIGMDTDVLATFLARDLGPILTVPHADLPWHLRPACEMCPFFASCRKEVEEKNSVSLLPGLTPAGRRFLHERAGVETLDDLDRFLTSPDADDVVRTCGSLRGKGERLRAQVGALRDGKVIQLGGTSSSLPRPEGVGLVLTLAREPAGKRVYAAGFRRFKGTAVYGTPYREWTAVARTGDECATVVQEFVRALATELEEVARFNVGKPFREQKSLQTYVLDDSERRLLLEALKGCDGPDAARLLACYAGEGEAAFVRYPVVVLSRVLAECFALPVPVAGRLPDALAALLGPDHPASFRPSSLFWPETGNLMKSDAVYMAWYEGKAEATSWIEGEVRRRLRAEGDLLDAVRDRTTPHRWAEHFSFPAPTTFRHPELADLAAVIREETALDAAEARRVRSLPLKEAENLGLCIRIECRDGSGWNVLSSLDAATLPDTGGMPSYLLVPDTAEGVEAARAFDDTPYLATTVPPGGDVRFAGIVETEERRGRVTGLTLAIRSARGQGTFSAGDRALLFPRATDFTSSAILSELEDYDASDTNDLLALIRDPRRFAVPMAPLCTPDPAALEGLTPSQRAAFAQIMENRLTLVWGPPGTGKTHFLAETIQTTARARTRPLRIAVSALTHAAIENLLFEIQNAVTGDITLRLSVNKLEKTTSPKGRGLLALTRDVLTAMTRVPDGFVLGGTAKSFQKHRDLLPAFDLLIIDEASQMTFGELALLLPLIREGGRLVLAGDDCQLPPIVKAAGADHEKSEYQDSVFAWLRRRDTGRRYTAQLLENWRMNSTLSRFPAETIYGPGYTPATAEIAARQIMRAPADDGPFVAWALDPAHPLAVVVLEEVRATVENTAEAALVADLTAALRSSLLQPGSEEVYPDTKAGDAAFWSRGLFVVSPHHAQIAAIKKALAERRGWKSEPFVDTVDKMQGQQCEAVVVSYGVSDPETALAEAAFIYSRNRLNVSVTRAQAKCIVFLPRPLLEPSFDLFQDPETAEGLDYMLKLVAFCRREGETRVFSLPGCGKVSAFRV
ncbi:bifunctional RecB family nuclease/DEAD/DEAH box helicase [Methanofollis ethanolicus]|uniref:bifunctional RecB family nuclease/DEAD/DEAH box helicase n=1 Tax=Methanofollis ethanolicus TaxID=488124 RepID=UPI000830DA07|nr:AAA domain-containing protein [Methanofollis ethanolicus]